MQKIDMIKAVSRDLRDLIVDTIPASLTGSTVDALKLIQPNAQQLLGKSFFIYEGAGNGQVRVVGSLDTTNRRIYFREVFGSIPSVNSSFVIFEKFDIDDYKNAFDLAYYRFFNIRTNTQNEWKEWVSAVNQKEAQWKNEKVAELATWVDNKEDEQNTWHAQQVDWELSLSNLWKSFVSGLKGANAFQVPSLNIHAPGTLSIGTIPIGSLYTPSLSLTAVPNISTIPSYSSTVLDEPLLFVGMEQNLIDSLIEDEDKWGNRRTTNQTKFDTLLTQEKEMVVNLINATNKQWEDHKQQFDITWAALKDRYERNFNLLQTAYGQHKTDIMARWVDIKGIHGGTT